MLAHCTGYTHFYKQLVLERKLSDWDANGSSKMTVTCLQFCALLSLVAYVPDALLAKLLAKAALAHYVEEAWSSIQIEYTFLDTLVPFVWKTFGSTVGMEPVAFRDA
eukprot:6482366-Amphidinium_carterae.1